MQRFGSDGQTQQSFAPGVGVVVGVEVGVFATQPCGAPRHAASNTTWQLSGHVPPDGTVQRSGSLGHEQQSFAPGVGVVVGIGVGVFATQPCGAPRHAASNTTWQFSGQVPPDGTVHKSGLSGHEQQSLAPGVGVLVPSGFGVKVAQLVPPLHAA